MEGLLKEFPNTLILRVRMPIVADLTYPRNFITKIIKYEKVGGKRGQNLALCWCNVARARACVLPRVQQAHSCAGSCSAFSPFA